MGEPEQAQVMSSASGCHGGCIGRYRLTRMGSFFSSYASPPYLWMNRHRKMLYLQTLLQRASAVSVPPLPHPGAPWLWVCLFRMRAVNHQLAACCFYFFLLTLQIPFTNRRRTFSALLKRHDCRTRVLLVDSPCNVIPRWFAFI